MKVSKAKIFSGIVLLALLMVIYLFANSSGYLEKFTDKQKMEAFVLGLGYWGPLAIIGLITLAVVFSPIPSAPVGVTSGLIYGKFWGTVYIVIGAELGAIIAFTIARFLGYEFVRKWFGEKINSGLLGSQRNLTWIVFVSRLLPFISFDVLSYAAGLTQLTYLRFILATFAGIIPISFLLAYFGYELKSSESDPIWIVLILGFLTLIPFIVGVFRRK